jgi:thioesterase domain-containing protein
MIPTKIQFIDALPLSPNGKLDRKALASLPAQPSPVRPDADTPLTDLEETVAEIWKAALGLDVVGLHDNFFELGGYSLTAAQVVTAVEGAVNQRLSLSLLIQYPTLASFAGRLQELLDGALPSSPLVVLRDEGADPPLTLVHPIGGQIGCYAPLVRLLPWDRPVYAFQADSDRYSKDEFLSLEDLAGSYLDRLLRQQPRGPYCLGGWSLGGVIAYEMARQLREHGEEVALLALFDSRIPPAGIPLPERDDPLLWSAFAREMGVAIPSELFSDAPEAARLALIAEEMKRSSKTALEVEPQVPARLFEMYWAHLRAWMSYKFPVYDAEVELFVAEENLPEDSLFTMQWEARVRGGVLRHSVPGDHYSMLQPPHLSVLAQRLAERLKARTL